MLGPLMSTSRLRRPSTRHSGRGLGLVELMVAVAVTGVLMAVAVPWLGDMLERRRVSAVADELGSMFKLAASQANVVGDRVTLHFEIDPNDTMSCALLISQPVGALDNCKCYRPAAQVCGASPNLVLRLFQLPKSDNVLFEASADAWGGMAYRLGVARNSPDFKVTNLALTVTGKKTGAKLQVQYNTAGRIRTCTPNSSMSGYPAC